MTSRHEREAEEARRRLRAMAPQIEAVRRMWDSQPRSWLASLNEVLAPQYREFLKDSLKRLPTGPKIKVPDLRVDYKSLFPDFGTIRPNLWQGLVPSFELIQNAQREQFAKIIAEARRVIEASLPPNWIDDDVSVPKNLEALLLDEGLALAWVPPGPIVARLFKADSAAARRRIIGTRWKAIARACNEELGKVADASLKDHAEFAREAAESLLDGKAGASQALSANLLDTILRAEFSKDSRSSATNQKIRPNVEDYPLRVAIVLGGIWGAHGEYWPENGERVPRKFSRHGSAHAVSRRQYSRVNAVIALMHVIALLRLIEVDLRDP